jgi:hypothetical protein
VLWYSIPSYRGPFIVRGARLDGPDQVAFGGSAPRATFIAVPPGPTVNSGGGYRTAPEGIWVRAAGCYGWQIDGTNLHETIIFRGVSQ